MMLDHVRDQNQAGMFQLYTVLDFPDFVKEASQTTEEDIKELPSHAFAWPSQRMLPIHTKHDTWLSAAFLHKFGAEMPEADRQQALGILNTAAEYWGIAVPGPEDVQEIPKEAALKHVITYPLLPEPMPCTVISGEELQKVADDILDGGKYPLLIRQKVACQVLGAPPVFVQELGEQTISDLQKVAGYGIGTEQAALGAVRQRWHASAHHYKPLKEGLEELSALIKTAAVDGLLSHEMTHKTASMLDAVDRFVGLHQRYNDAFMPPERQLFNVTLADFDTFTKLAVRLPNGEWVRKEDLQPVIPFLEESFGQKCASLDEAVEYVKTMPERRAKMLSTHLKGRGVEVL